MSNWWKKLKCLGSRKRFLRISSIRRETMLTSVQNRDSPLTIEINANSSTEECETTETISSVDDPGPSLTNNEKIIFNLNGGIVSGTADALLCQILPTPNYSADKETIFTLLLNLRAFISPNDLLQKLLQHCMFEQNSTSDNFRKERRTKMFENMYFFCKEWTTNIPYDFREPAMRDRLLEIFGLCVIDSESQQKCDQLMFSLRSALSKLERYELALRSLNQNIEDPPSTTDQFVGLAILCSDPLTVAQQLAHIELERLSMIGADEFVELLKLGKIDDLGFVSQNAKTANIRYYVEWFNQLTSLVATEILRHSRKRYRAKAIEFFIEVARECINVGNFNSLMLIVAGLSLQPVSRLKRTWARVEKSKLEILQHQLDPSGNFLSYRATLKAAIWRSEGAKQDAEQVIIPFFGLLMKDLFMLFCRCMMPLPNGHLNYTAFLQFSENVKNILKWKSCQCPFPRNSQVLQYLLLAANYSETNMLKLSYDYEVAELSAEKEQYKRLRMKCTENEEEQSLLQTRFFIVAICGGAVSIFGVIANALLAKLFVTKTNYRHSPFFFLGFVAAFDTLLDLTYILLLAVPITAEYYKWPQVYSLWISHVQTLYIIGQIFKISSVFCLIVASFERYWMTKHWTFTGFDYRKRWILLGCVVTVAVVVKLSTAMEIVIITVPSCDHHFTRYAVGQLNNRSWLSGFLNMLTISLPFVTLIFLNGGIVLMLRQQNIQQLRSLITELTMGPDIMKLRRRNLRSATNTLIVIINCYLISNLLHLFISLVEYLQPGLLQNQYPYEYRIAADVASLLTVTGNALRCPAHIFSTKDIREQLLPCILTEPSRFLKLFKSVSSNRSLIQKYDDKAPIRRGSERLENPPWISVLLLNHDDDHHNGEVITSCIHRDGLQTVFERDNIRRLSNIGIC